jgi:aminoglycoside phosphotransferase (APT) family kinase protein
MGRESGVGLAEAEAFLNERYGRAAGLCQELGGGDWSRAFSFRLDQRPLVVRFGRYGEDFVKDREAMSFAGPDLPVPKVLEIGEAFEGAYAISERHFGVFLETLDEHRFRRLLPALLRALDALRSVPEVSGSAGGAAGEGDETPMTWRQWLVETLKDRPGDRVSGWRVRFESEPELEALFGAAESALRGSLDACPESRHVLHSDLLNRNVLVSEDASRLEAVFDWGCSTSGDFLYEVAWFTFWAPWHPGLAAVDFRAAAHAHYRESGIAVPNFEERLRCYELHIGLVHLAYSTFAGRHDERPAIAARIREVLGSRIDIAGGE